MSAFGQTDLYVSPVGNDTWSGGIAEPNTTQTDGPLATITRARDIIRERKLDGSLQGALTVWLRGGRYPLDQPLVFGPEDSGPITYAAYPGEHPILDGGRRIDGWRVDSIGSTGCWVADLPDVAAGSWYFRQLFVNGERRQRPRLPKTGFSWMEDVPGTTFDADQFAGTDTFRAAPGDIQNWRHLTDTEVVVVHYWIEERLPIASFDEQTRLARSSRQSIFALKDDKASRFAKYYVDNVWEGLSEPGEWYLDRPAGRLYYIPLPGEDPDSTEVFAPQIEQFLTLVGRPDDEKYVEFLRFEGLTFRHADWYQPPGGGERWNRPSVDYAASAQAASNIPGAIVLSGARYCAVEDCAIEHVGWYGIEIGDGCTGNRIVGNEIRDLGAGGIKIHGSDADGSLLRRTGNNRVTDNHISAGGRVSHSAVGILSLDSFGNVIAHNHVHDLFYSGISSGWVWGYVPNVSANNRIEKNLIHDLGQGLLSDLAGIYILGVQPGTVLRGNVIHDVEECNYGGWGIYLDEGSSHVLVENNICYTLSSQGFHVHYGRENIVRNNVFAFGREGQASMSRAEGHNAFTFQRNMLIANDQPLFVGGLRGHLEKRAFASDLNLFWDVAGAPFTHGNGRTGTEGRWVWQRMFTMDEWYALGNDHHSIAADPRCRNPEVFDFSLEQDSPAFALGFQQIDTSDVGPRPKDSRDT